MNLGLYTRVSTEGQVRDGDSLADQEHDGRSWAAAHWHDVVAVYTDPGLSGGLPAMDRPGLLDAIEALESGAIDVLAIRDLDRLSRKLTIQEAVLEKIWTRPDTSVWEYACDREVLRDDPEDPMRTLMRQVQGAIKELDRAMIAKRLRDARKAKARKGQHANGPAPYGWETKDGELIPLPAEQRALDLMRQLAAEGLRHADIAAELRGGSHPTKRGGTWSQPVVSRILARDATRTVEQVTYQDEQAAWHSRGPHLVAPTSLKIRSGG